MVTGIQNPNFATPVTKMKIKNTNSGETITVLYNPETYTLSRNVRYGSAKGLGQDGEVQQYTGAAAEELACELFFDSFTSGAEAGSTTDGLLLEANSLLPSPAKADVRKWTDKVYKLMNIDGDTHMPPILKIEWGSLQFKGILISCSQSFTKFSEQGKPVRAVLTCQFKEYLSPAELAKAEPRNSPDTSKYSVIKDGDSLWALAVRVYGDQREWRRIADANAIANPRTLTSGKLIHFPAIME